MDDAVGSKPSKADVGFLFVHGIGAQRKGETLNEAGNALLATMKELPSFGVTEEIDCVLQRVETWGDAPAHAEMRAEIDGKQEAWLLAESHWADVFQPPKAAQTLGWALLVSPGLLLARAGEGFVYSLASWAPYPLHWWRILLSLIWMIAVVPLGLVLVGTLTLAVLLRAIMPIQGLRDMLARLEVIITSALGDSYLFSENQISRGAMESKVILELEWLEARAERVIVVAHSQGAAVSFNALQRSGPVDTLITFGAGISQLDWVAEGARDRVTVVQRWVLVAFWIALLGVSTHIFFDLAAVAAGGEQSDLLIFIFLGGWVALGGIVGWLFKRVLEQRRGARPSLAIQHGRWWDIWASADPVSGGPGTSWAYPQAVVSKRVFNQGNVLTDHTTYYGNREEFVSRILLAALSKPEPVPQSGVARTLEMSIEYRALTRQRRGRWLEAVRAALALLVAALSIGSLALATEVTRPVADSVALITTWLSGLPIPEWVLEAIEAPATRASAVVALLLISVLGVYILCVLGWKVWACIDAKAGRGAVTSGRLAMEGPQVYSAIQRAALAVAASTPSIVLALTVVLLIAPDLIATLSLMWTILVQVLLVAGLWAIVFRISSSLVRPPQTKSRVRAIWRSVLPQTVLVWLIVWGVAFAIAEWGLPPDRWFLISWTNIWSAVCVMAAISFLLIAVRFTSNKPVPDARARWVRDPALYRPFKYEKDEVTESVYQGLGSVAALGVQLATVATFPAYADWFGLIYGIGIAGVFLAVFAGFGARRRSAWIFGVVVALLHVSLLAVFTGLLTAS